MFHGTPHFELAKGNAVTRLNLVLTLALVGLAGCSEPEMLDGPDNISTSDPSPQVAQSATEAAAVWHKKQNPGSATTVHFFRYTNGAWSAPTDLGLGSYPDVALSDSGRAIVVYSGKARVFDGAAWSAEQTIAPSGVRMPATHPVATDAQGNGLVIFSGNGNAWIAE